MSQEIPAKFKKDTSYKDVIKFLQSKGFTEKEVSIHDKSANSKFGGQSFIRFDHKNFRKMKGSDYIPELIMFFDARNEAGYLFCLAADINHSGEKFSIPFFGEYSAVCKRNKTLGFVNNKLVEVFDNLNKFVEFIGYAKMMKLDQKKSLKFLQNMAKVRLSVPFLNAKLTALLEPKNFDYSQLTPSIDGIKQNNTPWSLFVHASMALLDPDHFVKVEFTTVDENGIKNETGIRRPITNVHRLLEMKRYLYIEFEHLVLGIEEEEEEEEQGFVEFNF